MSPTYAGSLAQQQAAIEAYRAARAAQAAARAEYDRERSEARSARQSTHATQRQFNTVHDTRQGFIKWWMRLSQVERNQFGRSRYEAELARMTSALQDLRTQLQTAREATALENSEIGPAQGAWQQAAAGSRTARDEMGAAGESVESWLALREQLHNANPWMPQELLDLYTDLWSEYGDADQATNALYQTDQFDAYFPGLRREDGTLRMSPIEYVAARATFDWTLANVYHINPAMLGEQFVGLIEGDVSMDEWRSRMAGMWERVVQAPDEYRQAWARFFGVEGDEAMTDAALLIAGMDPTLNQEMLNRQISLAEIAGQAALSGYMINQGMAARLYEAGMGEAAAQSTFQGAANDIPILGRASTRQFEGGFDLEAYLNAQVFGDAQARSAVQRILAGEASQFTEQGGVAMSESGALVGLRRR